MRLPCEQVVNDILPAVRSLVAKDLRDKGYSQTEIADLLNLTQPAVSQYLSASRGKQIQRIQENPVVRDQIEDLVDAILNRADDDELSQMLHDICVDILNEHERCTDACTHL